MFIFEMFSSTYVIYFDCIILLIFLKNCDFLKQIMQDFKNNKTSILNEYLFSYLALAYPIFQKQIFSQVLQNPNPNGSQIVLHNFHKTNALTEATQGHRKGIIGTAKLVSFYRCVGIDLLPTENTISECNLGLFVN